MFSTHMQLRGNNETWYLVYSLFFFFLELSVRLCLENNRCFMNILIL